MVMVETFLEILNRPTIWAMISGFMQFLGPVWIAFFLGVMVGWAWKPKRGSLGNCKFEFSAPSSPLSASISAPLGSIRNSDSCKIRTSSFHINPSVLDNGLGEKGRRVFLAIDDDGVCSPSKLGKDDSSLITFEDLKHLYHLVEGKDGGPPWKHVMDRSAHGMSYQAWQRDPEGGPPQYCSRTVYEDATPELLRDFFWDDEFRLEWDDMIINSSVIEECSTTGTMVVHWTRKFPFFCSDREYIAARRIWESGRSYYCVTKGVPCLSVPRRDKPRRVDLFYSSWYIQAVESPKGDGQLSACEVIFFHHEDMGIPRGLAKFGVCQGMWGAVKNIERGFRSYQNHRASGAPLSHYAFFAQINTRLDPNYLRILEGGDNKDSSSNTNLIASSIHDEKLKGGINTTKLLIIGGALAVACSIDRGLLDNRWGTRRGLQYRSRAPN